MSGGGGYYYYLSYQDISSTRVLPVLICVDGGQGVTGVKLVPDNTQIIQTHMLMLVLKEDLSKTCFNSDYMLRT